MFPALDLIRHDAAKVRLASETRNTSRATHTASHSINMHTRPPFGWQKRSCERKAVSALFQVVNLLLQEILVPESLATFASYELLSYDLVKSTGHAWSGSRKSPTLPIVSLYQSIDNDCTVVFSSLFEHAAPLRCTSDAISKCGGDPTLV